MKLERLIVGCMTLGLTISACGNVGDGGSDSTSGPEGQAEMALNVDLAGDTDVVGFRFEARRVSCKTGDPVDPEQVFTAEDSLEETTIPGDNSTFENRPYDEWSEHQFSDHLFTVPAGCYDLKAVPITESGEASEDCAVARLDKERVRAQMTNEFHLISQCRGEARTTLDVMASLNHPPEVELDVQKFMCAGAGVRVCATAYDPDDDPLRFYWQGTGPGCFVAFPDGPPRRNKQTGEVTQCVTIPSHVAESRTYKVIVKDLAWNKKRCKLEPIEELLKRQSGAYADGAGAQHHGGDGDGFDPTKSRAELYFPVHALGECIASPAAFIGVTMGANLRGKYLHTDPSRGMTKDQAKTLADNAVRYVNPNILGDPDPRILIVRDTANLEDKNDARYIEKLLHYKGYSDVKLIDEPAGGLRKVHTIGYKIIWFVNPGWPIDDARSVRTLKWFRANGGGVIVSGDDANQTAASMVPHDMRYFSGLKYDGDNGEYACGKHTDNNLGANYKVVFNPSSPLAAGLSDLNFPYGNDIDANIQLNLGEQVAANTNGLTTKPGCLQTNRPVITTLPAASSIH